MEGPPEVRGHGLLEVVDLHGLDGSHCDDAGVVDEDVDRTQALAHRVDQRLHLIADRDVADGGQHPGAPPLQVGAGSADRGGVAPADGHARPRSRELARQNEPQASGPASNQHRPVLNVVRASAMREEVRRRDRDSTYQQRHPGSSRCWCSHAARTSTPVSNLSAILSSGAIRQAVVRTTLRRHFCDLSVTGFSSRSESPKSRHRIVPSQAFPQRCTQSLVSEQGPCRRSHR